MNLLLVGALCLFSGVVAAVVHVAFVHRDVRRAVADQGLGPLVQGVVLRIRLPAATLTACGVLGHGPGLASGLVGFAVAQHVLRERTLRGAP